MNYNPGNMRNPGSTSGFQSFDTPEAGLDAMKRDLLLKVSGNSPMMRANFGDGYQPTLRNVISTWAPPTENDTDNYVNFVASRAGLEPDSPLSVQDVPNIMPHMITMEQGAQGAKQYVQADNGVANDANTDIPDLSHLSDAELDALEAQASAPQLPDLSNLSDEELDALEAKADGKNPQSKGIISRIGDTLMSGMDASIKGGAQLESNIIAPFLSEESRQKLRDNGLYDMKHPEIENPFERGIAESPLGAYTQALYGGISSPVAPLVESAEELAKKAGVSQQSLDHIHTAGTIAGMAGPPKPTVKTSIVPTVKKIANKIANVKDIGTSLPGALGDTSGVRTYKEPRLQSSNVRSMASDAFQYADKEGGILKSSAMDDIVNQATKEAPRSSEIADFTGGKSTPVTEAVEGFERLRGKPLTLKGAMEIDEHLGSLMDNLVDPKTGILNKQGVKIARMQKSLRERLRNAGEGDIVGGKSGFESWQKAQPLWATSLRMNELERILANAEMADNPVTAIKAGYRAITRNPVRLNNYPKEIRPLIKKAAETGIVTDALRWGGSRLISSMTGLAGGAVGGGWPGAIAGSGLGYAAGMPLRAAAHGLQKKRGLAPIDALTKQSAVQEALKGYLEPESGFSPIPQQKLLPAPTIAVDKMGNTISKPIVATDAGVRDVEALKKLNEKPSVAAANDPRNPSSPYNQMRINSFLKDTAWDEITAKEKSVINSQIKKMWEEHQTSLADIIRYAKKNAEDLASAKGEKAGTTSVGEALLRAKAKKFSRGGSANNHTAKFLAMAGKKPLSLKAVM